jgi:GT2 family glycosyltransferase
MPEDTALRLTIIIVNWNGIQFLPECLRSIADDRPPFEFQVLVVDNSSTDGSREWLLSDEPRAILGSTQLRTILSEENLGFAKANNLAINESESPYVFLLNPDTILHCGALERLVAELESRPEAGIAGPKVLNEDGTTQPSVTYFPRNPLTILMTAFGLAPFLPENVRKKFYGPHWDHNEKKDVPVIWGAAMMARRSMIDSVGGLDEDFFMYGEDEEWCARINRNGWKVVFVPEASVVHLGGKSSEQMWEADDALMRKYAASIQVEKKTGSWIRAGANALTRLAVHSLKYTKQRVTGRSPRTLVPKIQIDLSVLREIILPKRRLTH